MEVRGKIDEADVGRLQVGQKRDFTVDAYPDRVFAGRVLQIRKSPEVVQNVVTYTAIVSAPNPDLLLLPGMTAVLRIVISDTGDTLESLQSGAALSPERQRKCSQKHGASISGSSGRSGSLNDSGAPTPVDVRLGAVTKTAPRSWAARCKKVSR